MTATLTIVNKASPLTEGAGTRWVAPALVGAAALMWLAAIGVFVRFPLAQLPLYFANRYLVLDATSLLFIVVINTVFLGICVYLYSRERNTPALMQDIRSRSALMLLMMAVINIGLMANHLVLLWALIEVSTCAQRPWWRAARWPIRVPWPGASCCTPACRC
jgi:hydrogenase-4 component F